MELKKSVFVLKRGIPKARSWFYTMALGAEIGIPKARSWLYTMALGVKERKTICG